MRFASFNNGSFKRLRETPSVDPRPRKKSSPTPSDSESENESGVNNNWKNTLDQVFKKRSNSNGQDRKRRWKNRGSLVDTSQNPPSPVKNGPRWEDARINSVVQLATISPLSEEKVTKHLADLTLVTPASPTSLTQTGEPHPIFQMPEIVENILRFVSAYAEVPREKPYARRKPLSLEHARLIYKDEKKAMEVWNSRSQVSVPSSHNSGNEMMGSVMHNCMMVNRLWFHVTMELVLEKFHFRDLTKFRRFLQSGVRDRVNFNDNCNNNNDDDNNNNNNNRRLIKPKMMIFHKFHKLQQFELDDLSQFLSCESLKWLEFYICPDVVPPLAWIQKFNNLEKLILPGNKKIDDKFLIQVSSHVNNLKVLDLRACDKVTDSGIIAMAIRCPQLQACNLGRHRNSNNITSLAVVALARNTNLETLGTEIGRAHV